MTLEALIDGLNEDLAHEYQAVIAYTTYAAEVKGPMRPVFQSLFAKEAAEELEHARFLAAKIVALGGTPTTTAAPVPEAPDLKAMLEALLAAEEDTLKRYATRMQQAEELGDLGLAARLHAMIEDETAHKEELALILEGLR